MTDNDNLIEYTICYYLTDNLHNRPLRGPYEAYITAKDMEDAGVKAWDRLMSIGIRSHFDDVVNATITDPAGKDRTVLHDGDWKIDIHTGKPKENLEERLTNKSQ